ncbi:Peptidase S9, prolyl oligopeptidase, catalytic domain and Six-bladed beta-propeller, TolB-like domain-containing protein [Strongyloides ratti]|uniref:Peptidase S9, prolyl oligopeptidase, catalytic domain and Six-bladed beta-propeller, TolB-like domain-containing protein n=1 Tax=Strongyloides ratti TaxID=34506 RepID=A0A090MRH0_STRRB|nr:Peptidase S9, prolyl oligopeptidase, catalytic domain and Six-bladed beta-propeller, TolB-like domain-containing protein [Strongyloides ratti]CEF60813.1 Peptidase S9, prolyl oligopeptidase, catalytic domain and Six-bladed beta-propeller, TolB-like domain-containing protein [Strongyloides ratti]
MTSQPLIKEYGSWSSVIDTSFLSSGNCKAICELQTSKDSVFWVEQTFPKGRRALFQFNPKINKIIEWTDEQTNVAAAIHEYGGGAFHVSKSNSNDVFITQGRQICLLKKPKDKNMKSIINLDLHKDKIDVRHADYVYQHPFIYSVREEFLKEKTEPDNLLVSINIETSEENIIASGSDFYACPRLSPCGKYIAWIEWKKPNMPWDTSSIVVGEIEYGKIIRQIKVEHNDRSYAAVGWPDIAIDNNVYFFAIDDSEDKWNVYKYLLNKDTFSLEMKENLTNASNDVGVPLWQLGSERVFAVSSKENTIVYVEKENLKINKFSKYGKHDFPKNIPVNGYTNFSSLAFGSSDSNILYCIASGPRCQYAVIGINIFDGTINVVRESFPSEKLENIPISVPEEISFISDDTIVSGYFYPPYNPEFKAPENTLPPVIFLAHGGPTGQAYNNLDFKKQFYTSRGFSVFDINYRGSTGLGRMFRDKLKFNWGIVDRDDMINGAKHLISKKLVDPNKLAIYGSSAGGYLVLSVLLHPTVPPPFSAAVSVYGVADLMALNEETHKFEALYNDQLIAPWPSGKNVYYERSPINHIGRLTTPILFMHGLRDNIVSPKQTFQCYETVKSNNVMTDLIIFPDEGHGFRTAEAVQKSTEATYFFICKALNIKPLSLESQDTDS